MLDLLHSPVRMSLKRGMLLRSLSRMLDRSVLYMARSKFTIIPETTLPIEEDQGCIYMGHNMREQIVKRGKGTITNRGRFIFKGNLISSQKII